MRLRSKAVVMAGIILAGVLAVPAKDAGAMETKAVSISKEEAGTSKKKGWVKSGGKWYFYDSKGVKKTGWYQTGKGWYYLNPSSGAMVTGWKKISKKWYFFDPSGIMAKSEFRGGYWLNKDGTWTDSHRYGWKGSDGKWWFGNSSWYAKNAWYKINGKYYYFYKNGYMASKMWIGNSYVGASGAWITGKLPAGKKTSVKTSALPKYDQLLTLLGDGDLFATRHDCKGDMPRWFSVATDIRYGPDDLPVKATEVQRRDPLGRLYNSYNSYYKVSLTDLKWYASRVLNYSDRKISEKTDMDWEGYGYRYNSSYIFGDQGIGGPTLYRLRDMKVTTDGVYYYLDYYMDNEDDHSGSVEILETLHMKAVVSYKYDRGKYFWSLYTVEEVGQ